MICLPEKNIIFILYLSFFVICVISAVEKCQVLDQTCQARIINNKRVLCVCNSTYCDFLPPVQKVNSPNYLVYTSNKAGLRFCKAQKTFQPIENKNLPNTITIGREKYQHIDGFGGAFTDAVGINIKSLSLATQKNLLKTYFDDVEGIGYNIGRVPIGCTDFSERLYSYDDTPSEDPQLIHFNLVEEDYELKIPFIQEAKQLTNNKLRLLASAWTSPKWMKVIPKYATVFGELKKNMYQPWADYHIKFLEAYEKNNLTFWAITTGNEPSVGYTFIPLPTVAFTAPLMSKWIRNNFGPTIRGSKYSNIKIITLDDEKLLLPWFIEDLFKNETTKNYVDGIGLHWYFDAVTAPSVADTVYHKYNKFLIETEACRGEIPVEKKVDLGSWKRAEDIAFGIIEALKHWCTGWIDWNMALNEKGGPSYENNFVDSPIIVNASADEFYKQPMFYAMGHFAKFIPRDSVRINVTCKCNVGIQTVGIIRPDGGTVINILSTSSRNVNINIIDNDRGQISLLVTAHSLTSVIYW